MLKLPFPLGLITALLSVLICTVSGVTLDQLFVVNKGGTDSGCDKYFNQASKDGTLDDWLDEINLSLSTAIDNVDINVYNQEPKVRRALAVFFGIRNQGKAKGNTAARVQKISGTCQCLVSLWNVYINCCSSTCLR